jgi:hypothetical protein
MTPAAAPPPVAYAAAVPAPMPPVKGSGALKIILIVVGVFVLLGVVAASVIGYGAYRISKAVHVDKNGNGGMTINTANGSITAGSDSSIGAAELGVDVYPGASHAPGSMNIKSPDGAMATANFTTSDSVRQVVDFYKAKLGENASTMETSSGTILTSDNSNPNDSLVITVSADGGKTKIGIVHSTKNK